MNDPIKYYHDLLAGMSSDALEHMRENLLKDLALNKATYGNRLLTKYLRPKFITREQVKVLREVCTVLRNAVTKVKDAYLQDYLVTDEIGLTYDEKKLAAIDPGFSRICITSRWDSFWSDDGVKFVELNAESPAGVAYSDIMSDIYMQMPVLQEFKKRYRVQAFHVREILLDAILDTYLNWKGNKGNRVVPNIAIVDWSDVPTYPEFELLKDFFEFHGVPTIIADPRELDYSKGRLRLNDFEIDVVYRRVLIQEFMEKFDEVQPLLNAYKDQNVCVINSFRTKIVHKKSLFAILSNPKNEEIFSDLEKDVIARHIPWTRILRETKTDYKGASVDLLDYVSENRETLVIKPNDEYGGTGVILGWENDQETWEAAIRNGLNEVCVVQEKVPTSRELFPFYDNGLEFEDMLVDLDPFLFGVNTAGILTRLSGSSLANVTSGGGAAVTFIIAEKTG